MIDENNNEIEEMSIQQVTAQLFRTVDRMGLAKNHQEKLITLLTTLEIAVNKARDDNHSKIKEIADILQESVIKDFKQYNSKV